MTIKNQIQFLSFSYSTIRLSRNFQRHNSPRRNCLRGVSSTDPWPYQPECFQDKKPDNRPSLYACYLGVDAGEFYSYVDGLKVNSYLERTHFISVPTAYCVHMFVYNLQYDCSPVRVEDIFKQGTQLTRFTLGYR